MCGIAGSLCLSDRCRGEDHVPTITDMCRALSHRGPDDEGVDAIGRACFGSVRLSIIDPSDAGHMPMSDDKGRWWITYNGEVYNFAELRGELTAIGHTFRSKTDTEVVLHAFQEWGEACLDRFIGMFSFAVYDREEDVLTLVRDRYGIKPLYYMTRGGHFFFSSEIKGLLRVEDGPVVNKRSLIEWFLYRNVEPLTGETLLEGVSSLSPAHLLRIEGGGEPRIRRYYCPTSHVDVDQYRALASAKRSDVVGEIETAIRMCTTDRLVSDVPIGTLCSGGLDSSLITVMAARERKDITAFHVSVEGYRELDEEPFARRLTGDLGIDLVTYPLDAKTFRAELPHIIHQCDSPLTHPNSVAYYLICRTARDKGVKVLLSGEGADELFGGYRWRYRRHRNLLRAQRLFRLLPHKARRGIRMLTYATAGMPATDLHFDSLMPQTVSFIDRYSRVEWLHRCEAAYGFEKKSNDRSVLGTMLSDLNDFLAPLLRRLDRTSMGASVECRVPYLDHRLVGRSINLPLDYRLGKWADKWIVRRIGDLYLPGGIAKRKKVGFPLPLADYLAPLASDDLFRGGFCEEVLELGENAIHDLVSVWHENIFTFFNILSLEIWGRIILMGETVDGVRERIAELES